MKKVAIQISLESRDYSKNGMGTTGSSAEEMRFILC
jgi:hypothetical protein